MKDRADIAKSTAAGLRAFAAQPNPSPALIGFDGFVDSIISVVDKRHSVESFDPIPTIADFGARVSAKAGQSSNYELVVNLEKLGGNGPIMANALASAGVAISYVGCLGYPSIHPVFKEFSEAAEVFSVAEPGFTDALEFDDGKLMLGKYETISNLDWPTVETAVGADMFAQLVHRSRLIGLANWTMLNKVETIWSHIGDLLAAENAAERKKIFVDLADPAKRTPADIRGALDLLSKLQGAADVTLGLNLSESTQASEVLGLDVPSDPEAAIEASAAAIREAMGIYCCVIHPRKGAAAAMLDAEGGVQTASFLGPFVAKPKLSTGAGDNFNGGFCLGLLAGLPIEECLCTGVGTSGYYVRNAHSPSLDQLAEFCDHLPPAE
ncbi:PfkB family carbohydrate kinase [Algisphaera agarilytica]|uniref:Sugar/nucleoside kinase (Ribokinase family) n=1 Tax=Algisphaera agarilytica TaxID=1385975 RepID=A0A7X0H9P8_9BACT|nr:PfkB family carbohydrate kinase [Algisphaera agarilytica]MBB6430374.1 sugar/nucleoside kinase (ribokinase family) [Algisphaera agarilytica]